MGMMMLELMNREQEQETTEETDKKTEWRASFSVLSVASCLNYLSFASQHLAS
jgi:hypothetical protein